MGSLGSLGDIRILLAVEGDDVARLIVLELESAGYRVSWQRVDSPAALAGAVESGDWHVVVCWWGMAKLDVDEVIEIVRRRDSDLPILVVAENISDEMAIQVLRRGAQDVISKDHLARLVPAIERERREACERSMRRQAEAARSASEARLHAILNNSLMSVVLLDRQGRIEEFNQLASVRSQLVLGTPALCTGGDLFDFIPEPYRSQWRPHFERACAGEVVVFETELRATDGENYCFEISFIPIRQEQEISGVCASAVDITAHRAAERALQNRP